MPISSPYNFVPLNEHVFIPEWGKQVSHDLPFREGESGVIDVEFRNITPLFVRGVEKDRGVEKGQDNQPASFIDENGNKCYFIPGSSLRGMLRSVMEILSFGRLSQINKGHFGYRDFRNNDYKQALQCVHAGWLRKDKDDKLKLTPCLGEFTEDKQNCMNYGFKTVTHKEIRKRYHKFSRRANSQSKLDEIGDYVDWGNSSFQLVCTGSMENRDPKKSKKIEYLFSKKRGKQITLSDVVKEQFLEVQKTHPLFDSFFKKRLEERKEIPVFYSIDSRGEVIHVGLTRYYRIPFPQGVKDGVPKSHELSPDLCELVFGRISKEGDALKGRVVLGHAFPISEVDETQFKKVSGILGEPRASFYPYYLAHNGTDYNTYNTSPLTLAGRKRYRIHTGNTTTDLPQGNKDEEGKIKNEDVITKFNALHEGITFGFRIMVHNLLPQELGALLSALTLHQQEGVYHNLGMAKGYGYGKLELTKVSLNGFKHDKVKHYLEVFEEEMSDFTLEKYHKSFTKTQQVRALLKIATEHEEKEVRMMELKEYGQVKTEHRILSLEEYNVVGKVQEETLLARFKQKHLQRIEKDVLDFIEKKDFNAALLLCNNWQEKLPHKVLDWRKLIDKVQEREQDLKIAKEKEIEQKRERERQQKLEEQKAAEEFQRQQEQIKRGASSFASLLEENVNGKYKVTTLKVLLDKVKRRCKDKGCSTLDEQDVADLKATLDRLEQKPDRKEKSAWANRESAFWKYLTEVLGESETNEWFSRYNPQ